MGTSRSQQSLVHPLLRKPNLNRFDLQKVKRLLESGPWCWPSETEQELCDQLSETLKMDKPIARVGAVLLVAVKPTDTSLWVLERRIRNAPSDPGTQLAPRAAQAWKTAGVAISRSLPVLWRSIEEANGRTPHGVLIAQEAVVGKTAVRDGAIDGGSFGLSMALGLASTVLNTPVEETVATSAAIDERGVVQPIEMLSRKINMICSHAPRVKRFLVATQQAEEAKRAAGGAIEIVGVSSVAEAIDSVFPDLVERLVNAGGVQRDRNEIVDSLFRLAIEDRSAAIQWSPVYRTAKYALEHWPALTAKERYTIQFVCAVAARHDGVHVPLKIPTEDWLVAHPSSNRLKILAHLTQQSASFADPVVDDIATLIEKYLVRGLDAHDGHLRLLGAYGRLLAVRGQPHEAMELQREATLQWMARYAYEQVAMPLGEWMRLASALGDERAASQALRVHQRLLRQGEIDANGRAYLEFARGRVHVTLEEYEQAIPILRGVCNRWDLPTHVLLSALRWLARAHRSMNEVKVAASVVSELEMQVSQIGEDKPLLRLFAALADLDESLETNNLSEAEKAAAVVHQAFPFIVDQLRETAPLDHGSRQAKLEYLRDFFPY